MLFMWEELMGRCCSHQTIISPSVCLHKAVPRQEQNYKEGENKRSLRGKSIWQCPPSTTGAQSCLSLQGRRHEERFLTALSSGTHPNLRVKAWSGDCYCSPHESERLCPARRGVAGAGTPKSFSFLLPRLAQQIFST